MGAWAGDTEVVLLAAPALQAILATSPFLTAATFAKFDVLAVLAAVALKQAEAALAQVRRLLTVGMLGGSVKCFVHRL